MEYDLEKAHKMSFGNRKLVEASQTCGCFCCGLIFNSDLVDSWIPDKVGDTAQCPECIVDSVLSDNAGFPITKDFLKIMHKHWFGNIE